MFAKNDEIFLFFSPSYGLWNQNSRSPSKLKRQDNDKQTAHSASAALNGIYKGFAKQY